MGCWTLHSIAMVHKQAVFGSLNRPALQDSAYGLGSTFCYARSKRRGPRNQWSKLLLERIGM